MTESAQAQGLDLLARTPMTTALVEGLAAVRQRIAEGLTADDRLAATGIAVLDVRVVAIRSEPDVEKALRAPTRETVQQEADRATYERGAMAVERERAISENQLQNQIEMARREEDLVAQWGANARREAEAAAAADASRSRPRRAASGNRLRPRRTVRGRWERPRPLPRPRASTPTATWTRRLWLALAANELAGSMPEIGNLVLSPDLLAPVLTRLAGEGERS